MKPLEKSDKDFLTYNKITAIFLINQRLYFKCCKYYFINTVYFYIYAFYQFFSLAF